MDEKWIEITTNHIHSKKLSFPKWLKWLERSLDFLSQHWGGLVPLLFLVILGVSLIQWTIMSKKLHQVPQQLSNSSPTLEPISTILEKNSLSSNTGSTDATNSHRKSNKWAKRSRSLKAPGKSTNKK